MRLHNLIMALAAFAAALPIAAADEPLRIVFIAYQNPDQLAGEIEPVVAYLERETGMQVKDFVATNYAGVVEALKNGTADVGFMGPLQYIIAHQQAGAKPLLGELYNGKATYESHIFVRKDSGINALEDLKGKSIAFTDPISSSGYLYPLAIFREKGLVNGAPEEFFKRVYFAGGDEQAIRAVYNKFVDAVGVGQYSYNLLRPDERDAVKVLAASRPIPSHCIVVRKGLSKEAAGKLKKALLALNEEGPDHGLLQNLYSVDGYTEITHEDFAETERLARELGLIK